MNEAQAITRGREAFDRRAWADACRLLEAAGCDTPLPPEDLERLATAAYLMGHDDASEARRTRAHELFLERHDAEGAARTACWLAYGLLQRGARAPAAGWFARAARILDEARLDSALRGYLLVPVAIQQIVQGDPAAGHDTLARAADIARRFGDRDLASLAYEGRGRALIRLGRVADGVALLDEAMVAVIAGEVTPAIAGDVYCSVLEGCQEIFDVRRSHEWTTSLARWCGAQPDLMRYRGECLLYRAEVQQWRGDWQAAARDADDAWELLQSRPAAGAASYRAGELLRLRGNFAQADKAYARAHERGRSPQPGLALLRLAQGEVDAAAASIRVALTDACRRDVRARLLPAAVEILLAAQDVDSARGAAAELSSIAAAIGTPFLAATAAQASGMVLLADDDPDEAGASLRRACAIWHDLGVPYHQAQACRLIATACERRGDREGHRLERAAARTLLERLGVRTDLPPAGASGDGRPGPEARPLTDRERQVLRLLATGRTNRAIAEALAISEKTVARHVSNIFDKLDVASRTAATAWAFQHGIV